MVQEYAVKKLDIAQVSDALNLVWKVFLEFEAPDYCEEGIDEFRRFIEYESIKARLEKSQYKMWCCFDQDRIVGVIAPRPPLHISLLFVDRQYHRRGIARKMLEEVIAFYSKSDTCHEITVNSSPYAAQVYHRLGFEDTDAEQTVNGIRYISMKRMLHGFSELK